MTSRKSLSTVKPLTSRRPPSSATEGWLPDSPEPAIRAAAAGQWTVDLADGALRCSRQAAALFGWDADIPPRSLVSVIETFIPDDRSFVVQAFDAAARHGAIELEKRILRNDGVIRWLHISGRVVSPGGNGQQMAGIVTDVTTWHVAEDRQHQQDRLEHFGYLCRKVAHDYNNLLMVIGANMELLNERVADDDEKAVRYFKAAHMAVERGAAFNRQLLAFAGRLEFRTQRVNPLHVLKAAETRLRDEAGAAIHLRIDASPEPSPFRVATDPDHLLTAVLNLVSNARDAMPNGGTLVLSVTGGNEAPDAPPHGLVSGPYVVVSVADTGTGIADTIIDRVFEPFFTTREPGTAKGLGLSQVYGFAKQSGGFATIAHNVPTGTTVSIHLPQLD